MKDIEVVKHGKLVTIYNINLIEEYAVPDLDTAYNHSELECPKCEQYNTCCVKLDYDCPIHGIRCMVWFCIDCEILFEYQLMEEYEEEGGDTDGE